MDLYIRYLGQEGFLLKWDNISICFDLYLSDSVKEITGTGARNYDPPIKAGEISDVDYYFISHDHLDHLDPYTISELTKKSLDTIFVCPSPYLNKLLELGIKKENIVPVNANKQIELNGLKIYPIPQKHEEYLLINGDHGNLGYIVEYNGFRIFHSGDGIADKKLADALKDKGPFDIMFVPINGHDWKRFNDGIMGNMNYREALDLCNYVGTELVVPMHYDLFGDNTENPAFFVDYLYREYPFQKFKMFIPGENIILRK